MPSSSDNKKKSSFLRRFSLSSSSHKSAPKQETSYGIPISDKERFNKALDEAEKERLERREKYKDFYNKPQRRSSTGGAEAHTSKKQSPRRASIATTTRVPQQSLKKQSSWGNLDIEKMIGSDVPSKAQAVSARRGSNNSRQNAL